MRDKEIVGLWEAYLQVHQPKEEVEQLDEISTALADRVVNARIAGTGRAFDKEMKDRTPENMRASMKAAAKEEGAKRLAAGVRRRRNATNEEVENWVNSLIDEGYDLSEYTWDDMYEMYVTEGPNYDKNRQRAAQRAAARNAARKEGKTGNVPGLGYVSPRPERETYRDSAGVERHTSGAKMPKKEVKEDYSDAYEMYVTEADSIAAMRARAAKRRKQRYGASDTSRGGRDDFAPITDYEAANKEWERPTRKENVDLFDAILEHLVAEGYADTNENALVIMANMSEEWRESIVEAYQEPKFNRKAYLKKLSKRGGMGMGTPDDPHGYRDPGMAKVGAEFSKRKTAAAKARKTGEPDKYRAEKESQSKMR